MRPRGFTLVELLIAVTIFAIVAAIAVPSYTRYTERSYRTEAQSDLLNCAQALERFNAANFTYVGTADTDGDGIANAGSTAGPIGTDICAPLSVTGDRYAITIAAAVNTFTLTADPATGPMADDGYLTLDEAGNREWDENDDGTIGANEDDWVKDT